jgi:hypothetical protein
METLQNSITKPSLVSEYLELKDENQNAFEPAVLGQIINLVTGYIERYCNRHFVYGQFSEEVCDTDIVQCRALPIDRTQALTVYDADGNETALYTAKIEHSSAGIIRLSKIADSARVEYSGGYTVDWENTSSDDHKLPADITGIATRLSARIFEKRFSEGKTNESVEGQSISWASLLTEDDKALLDSYRVY